MGCTRWCVGRSQPNFSTRSALRHLALAEASFPLSHAHDGNVEEQWRTQKKQKCVQESGKEHKSEIEKGVDCIIIRLQDGCGAHSCPTVNPQALSHVPPRGTLAPSYGRPQAPKPSSSSQMLLANVSLSNVFNQPLFRSGHLL